MKADRLSAQLASLAGTLHRHMVLGHILTSEALAPFVRVLEIATADAVALEVAAAELEILEAVARDCEMIDAVSDAAAREAPTLTAMRSAVARAALPVPGTNVIAFPVVAFRPVESSGGAI
ncbi:hypothetical protein V5G24_00085 [Xanthobacter sp. VTT E-85241]|uniref:hypothetical protein n=1 Tax=Roseixanthobacter finlandensis TaxID=3119922 RepID=UPI00372AC906